MLYMVYQHKIKTKLPINTNGAANVACRLPELLRVSAWEFPLQVMRTYPTSDLKISDLRDQMDAP